MKKSRLEDEETVVYRPGGTDRAVRELALATHRLTLRRIRDSLPGKVATRRLVLRAPIRGDVPELVKLADNKAVADRLLRLPHPYTRADALGFIELIAQRPDERPYAITLNDRLVGVIGSQVLKETAMPSSAALAAALVVALIAAAIYTWLPMLVPDAKRVMLNLPEKAYPLIGAVIGYHLRR